MPRLRNTRQWYTGFVVLFLMVFTVFSSIITPSYVQAETVEDGVELTLSPTKARLPLDPGAKHKGVFTILNSGDSVFTFKVYTAPYQVANEQYNPTFTAETARTQISRWIQVPTEEFMIKPGQKIEVPYVVSVPVDVASGGQYAAIFAETTDDAETGGSIVAKKRVGMLVYGNISGDTRESGEVITHSIERWQYTAPLTATWRIKNTGNTDFAVSTKMTIKDVWGKEIFSTPEGENTVLPDTTRSLDVSWTHAGVGLYYVTTTTSFLDTSQIEQHWVLVMSPVLAAFIIICVIMVIGGIIYAIRKQRRSKKIQQK